MKEQNREPGDLFHRPELPPSFGLFDVHVHIGPSDSGEIFYPYLTGQEYLAHMQESHIDHAFAFAPYRLDGYRQANRDLLAWAEHTQGRIRPFARLGGRRQPITAPESWMVRRKMAGWLKPRGPDIDSLDDLAGFAGVKLLPQLDGLPDNAAFKRITELGLPVLVHGGTHSPPSFIARHILPKVPGPLIVAHCGCFPCDDRAFFDAIELADRDARVYLDTSGVAVSEFLRRAAQSVPDKLLFGSDAPLSHPLVAWHHLASTIDDDRLLKQIGGDTARALFGA